MPNSHFIKAYWIPKEFQSRKDKFKVKCEIIKSKVVFGRIVVMIQPVNGLGCAWVNKDKLEIIG